MCHVGRGVPRVFFNDERIPFSRKLFALQIARDAYRVSTNDGRLTSSRWIILDRSVAASASHSKLALCLPSACSLVRLRRASIVIARGRETRRRPRTSPNSPVACNGRAGKSSVGRPRCSAFAATSRPLEPTRRGCGDTTFSHHQWILLL